MIKNVFAGHGQKWAWSVWSWVSEIDCISRMNRWSELIFWYTGPLAVARRILWNRMSVPPSCFLLRLFLELEHQVSLKFGILLKNLIKLCVPDFLEKLFLPPRNWGNGPKAGFSFNLKKNLVIYFPWICSTM